MSARTIAILAFIILVIRPHTTLSQIPTDPAKRYSSYPFISGDTFRSLCDHVIDETNSSLKPNNMQQGDIIFVRGYQEFMDQFLAYLPAIKQKFILITHNMDASMPGNYAFLLEDDRLIAWFTQNKGPVFHSKLFGLPIGIANAYWKHGNIKILTQAVQSAHNAQKKNLLYLNFSKHTNIQARNHVLQYFSKQPYCTLASPKPWNEYLYDLSISKFVLSPPGNGLDCHRTWEAILMGSIPVMISTSIDDLFDDLPVLIVKDWKYVNQKFLENKYKEIVSKKHRYHKAYADYWIDQIRKVQLNARPQESSK